MKRKEVVSSNVSSIGYDLESLTLEIEIFGGLIYQYFDIPEDIYEGLMEAPSKGSYINRNIKDKYKYMRIS